VLQSTLPALGTSISASLRGARAGGKSDGNRLPSEYRAASAAAARALGERPESPRRTAPL